MLVIRQKIAMVLSGHQVTPLTPVSARHLPCAMGACHGNKSLSLPAALITGDGKGWEGSLSVRSSGSEAPRSRRDSWFGDLLLLMSLFRWATYMPLEHESMETCLCRCILCYVICYFVASVQELETERFVLLQYTLDVMRQNENAYIKIIPKSSTPMYPRLR